MNILVDVFPIKLDLAKFPLTSFVIQGARPGEIGATYAARVRKMRQIPCAWVRDEKRIIASTLLTRHDALALLRELQAMKLEGFDLVEDILQETNWQPSPNAIAQFVARGLLDWNAKGAMVNALKGEAFIRGVITVDREPILKGIAVGEQPALQISLHSPMNCSETLEAFYKKRGESGLKGLGIKCKDTKGLFNGLKGTLDGQIGTTSQTYRQRFKEWNPTDYDAKLLDTLQPNHLVVELKPYSSKKPYWYPIGVLRIVAEMGNLRTLGLASTEIKDVVRRLKIPPAKRRSLAVSIKDSLVKFCAQKYPAVTIEDSYSAAKTPERFAVADQLEFSLQLCFGNEIASVSKDSEMLPAIKAHGLYKYAEWYSERKAIRFAIIDAIPDSAHHNDRFDQLGRFKKHLEALEFALESVTKSTVKVVESNSEDQRVKFTTELHKLIRAQPDVILIYLPDSDKFLRKDEATSLYNTAKSICIGNGIASQVIHERIITDTEADANLIMGILAKTGNIPYVLAEEMDYLDVIVGLDIARKATKNGGSLNTAAMSRVYTNRGALLGYSVSGTMLVEGETIPQAALERILSPEEFSGKRVGVHRDGWYRGDEYEKIMAWGKRIKAEFYPIEVVKSGAGRLYKANGSVDQAEKATAFMVNDKLAYLISSLPPGRPAYSTANPLQVNNLSTLTQRQALHSVLALTLLHYGSVRPPRLPVSTHASDKIAGFLLKNIQPNKQSGDTPFWL